MSESLPFFSQPWCEEALHVANAEGDIRGGLADSSTFTLSVVLECTDRDELGSRLEFVAGEVASWTTGTGLPLDRSGASFRAPLEIWRRLADGDALATALLMDRRLTLKDTKRQAMAANYRAVDSLFGSWGRITTDWDL